MNQTAETEIASLRRERDELAALLEASNKMVLSGDTAATATDFFRAALVTERRRREEAERRLQGARDEELRVLVRAMRAAQSAYLKSRDRGVLLESQRLEREVDRRVGEETTGLFGATGA